MHDPRTWRRGTTRDGSVRTQSHSQTCIVTYPYSAVVQPSSLRDSLSVKKTDKRLDDEAQRLHGSHIGPLHGYLPPYSTYGMQGYSVLTTFSPVCGKDRGSRHSSTQAGYPRHRKSSALRVEGAENAAHRDEIASHALTGMAHCYSIRWNPITDPCTAEDRGDRAAD